MKSLVAILVMFLLVATFGLAVGAQQPGTLDTSWGGPVVPGVAWVPWTPWAIAAYPGGGIVAVTAMQPGWGVFRLDEDGILMTSFGGPGSSLVTLFPETMDNQPYDVAVQTNGKIVVTGQRITDKARFTVVRLNADGSLDTDGFGVGGVMEHTLGSSGCVSTAVAIQDDGKIVIGGYAAAKKLCPAVMRLNSDGTLDSSFGTKINPKKDQRRGYIVDTTDAKKISVSTWKGMIAIDADQRILLAGWNGPFIRDAMVARYTSQGEVDNSFNGSGRVWLTSADLDGEDYVFPEGLAVHGSTVFVSGTYQQIDNHVGVDMDPFIVSYNEDGSRNTGFGSNGFLRLLVDGNARGCQMAVQEENGRLLLGVGTGNVYRLLSTGMPDSSFGGDGISEEVPGGAGNVVLVPGGVYLTGPNLNGVPGIAKFYR